MKTEPNASDITNPIGLESLLEGWSTAHPTCEVTFYRLNKTAESPSVCKIAYTIGKGALVLQAMGETYRDAFLEVSERVNRTVGKPFTVKLATGSAYGKFSGKVSDITRRG